MDNLDFYLHLVVTRGVFPLLLLERSQKKPTKKGLNKTQNLNIIPRMSRFQLEVTHHIKNQENLNSKEIGNQYMLIMR